MEILSSIGSWIYTNIFTTADMLLLVLCFIGQMINRKGLKNALAGGLKCLIGFNVYSTATSTMTSTFRPLLYALKDAFGMEVVINDVYYGNSAMLTYFEEHGGNAGQAGIVLWIAFGLMIAFALFKKITKVRDLPLQGHGLVVEATRNLILISLLAPVLDGWQLIIIAALFMATKMSCIGNISVEASQDLTDGSGMTVAHNQMFLDGVMYKIGMKIEKDTLKKTGRLPRKIDDLELPGWLSIFNDVYVACFIVMFIFFGAIMLIMGQQTFIDLGFTTPDASFLMYIFNTAATFPISLVIMFTGLKMFSAEIMASFDGISEKLLHGVLPGIDVAAFYGFCGNPNVITLGFLVGTLLMIISTIIMALLNVPVIVMVGYTQMMFDNASVGMFGYKRGGLKGLLLGVLLVAIADTWLAASFGMATGLYVTGGLAAPSDTSILYGTFGWLFKLGVPGIIAVIIIIGLIPTVQYIFTKDKEDYWLVASDWDAYKAKHPELETPIVNSSNLDESNLQASE